MRFLLFFILVKRIAHLYTDSLINQTGKSKPKTRSIPGKAARVLHPAAGLPNGIRTHHPDGEARHRHRRLHPRPHQQHLHKELRERRHGQETRAHVARHRLGTRLPESKHFHFVPLLSFHFSSFLMIFLFV